MKIALIQEKQNRLYDFKEPSQHFEKKELVKLQKQMIDQNLLLLKEASENLADLAMTSEAVNFPGQPFRCQDSPVTLVQETQDYILESCGKIAREGSMYVVVGMYRLEADGKLYNSAVVFDRAGKEIVCYHKNFLAGDEKKYLTPGQGFPIWDSEFGKIGIAICWDMQFPETVRSYARQGADLILCPSWGWEEVYGHARAYENGIYVASAMAVPFNKGIEGKRTPSEIVSPDGRVLVRGVRTESGVLYGAIPNIRDCGDSRSLRIGDLEEWLDRQRIKEEYAL